MLTVGWSAILVKVCEGSHDSAGLANTATMSNDFRRNEEEGKREKCEKERVEDAQHSGSAGGSRTRSLRLAFERQHTAP